MHFNNNTYHHVIGINIKHYRKQAELIQAQLAEHTKIINYLSKIEAAGCDKSHSISVLNQITDILGIETTAFFRVEVDTQSYLHLLL